jgi:hypothetical protein
MAYFSLFPNLQYQSFLPSKNSSLDYITVKNLFRRVKIRDDLKDKFFLLDKYQIPDGARPDTVAEEFYGKADYDWVVLLSAGIINLRDEWPLSDNDVYNFSVQKYTIQHLNDVHHYETTEVLDSQGRLILPEGKVVNSNFNITDPNDPLQNLFLNPPVVAVSNFEYETLKNNLKRSIYILRPAYLQQFVNDMNNIMYYNKNSEYVTGTLIQTENTNIIG